MYGREIPAPPTHLDATAVLIRILDGLAFRYYWATEELTPEDHAFRPGPQSMSTHELMEHVLHLVFMIKQTILDTGERESFESDDPEVLRRHALENLARVREHLEALDDDELANHRVLKRDASSFPVWNIMNGPIADALTHVGQINAWRRLSGNPPKRANVFAGTPPRRVST
jgi:hypothetical protein